MKTFIQAISQISLQEPLSDQWFSNPHVPQNIFNESIEPDYKRFLSPMEARRMGKLMKRAITTSLDVLHRSHFENVDAIISGTGLGCIDNTEKFLHAIIDNNEDCLPPTAFMQSTHNTISSQIALYLKCHGYNSTYSHRGTSFESSLLDAFVQMKVGDIHSALVGGHDEMTPDYFNMLGKLGYWKKDPFTIDSLKKADTIGSISGSCSLALLLTDSPTQDALCQLNDVELMYAPSITEIRSRMENMLIKNGIALGEIDAVVMGLNGDIENDAVYHQISQNCFPNIPVVWYKHVFGESYSASSFGAYTASQCLKNNLIPPHLLYNSVAHSTNINHVLVYNHFQNKDHSLILLSKI
jgi:3-oxoacyl-[acyl-carrier-protein] synthase II